MIRTALCETEMSSEQIATAVTALRLAMEVIDDGAYRIFIPGDAWPAVLEPNRLIGSLRGNTVRTELSGDQFRLEVTDRRQTPAHRFAFCEDEPSFDGRDADYVHPYVGARVGEWLEALVHPIEASDPSIREASQERAESIATAAAYAFGADFALAEVLPPLGGRRLRFRLHTEKRSVEFLCGPHFGLRAEVSPELASLLMLDPAWAHWTASVREGREGEHTLVDIEGPRLQVGNRDRLEGLAVLRLVAHHLTPGARLLWDGSETAPAGFLC